MLDVGWSELLVIGAVALIVVGPKELPKLLRTVGQYVGKARSMAREFQRSLEDAARDTELKELTTLKRDLAKAGRVDFSEQARRTSGSLASGGKPKPKPSAETSPDAPAGAAAPVAGSPGKTAEDATPAASPAPAAEPAPPAGKSEATKLASGDR